MLNFVTAGESHGPQLTGILTGLPAGLTLDLDAVNAGLAARQGALVAATANRSNTTRSPWSAVCVTGSRWARR